MTYRVESLESVVRDDIPSLSTTAKRQVRAAIDRKLGSHPVEFGRPLRYSFKSARRLRVGDYRVIYTIEAPDVVLIATFGRRREVYED